MGHIAARVIAATMPTMIGATPKMQREHDFKVGETVNIAYLFSGTLRAKVLKTECDPPWDLKGLGPGWILVEQITDYEDVPEGQRPQFEAAVEFVWRDGEPEKSLPFSGLF